MTRGIRLWVCVAAAGALAAAPSAGATGTAQLRLGGTPRAAADATDIGGLSTGTPIHLTVVLKPRSGLAAFVQQVSDPASALYRAYLTPAQFGQRFGATPAQLAAVEASLRSHGLSPGAVSANRLSISMTADAATVQRAFSLSLRRVRLISGRLAVVPNAAPAVDTEIAGDVQAILGLTTLSAPRPLSASRVLPGSPRRARRAAAGHVATGGPQPCSAAQSTASADNAYTADQIASTYRFSGLYGAGKLGRGETVAVYELEPNDPQDIATYQSCYGTSAQVSYVPVDGGAGSGAGAGEAALDIEQVIGLAPKATILVYQGPNSGSGTPGSGPYDTYSAIINQDRAQVITTSWGVCEPDNGTDAANAESALFEQAAAEGQTMVAAAGDTGSEDCTTTNGLPTTSLAVDDPGSQPFVTSVGGTTLHTIGPPPVQTVWNGGGNAGALTGFATGATGGGISQLWRMPGYQQGAAGSLNVIQADSSGSPCNATNALCREVPDIAADADPTTGYVVYYNGSGSQFGATSGWQSVAGTSAASPLWAALVALINGSSACQGSPIGFANPTLYKVAGASYAGNFDDVTSGNNDYTGTNGGRYPAGPAFDMATGLGTPNATALAASLCPAAFRVLSPGRQQTSVGQNVSLQISTNDRRGGIVYAAAGLPGGLSLNSSTGQITGRPKRAGTNVVVVAASNRDGAVRSTEFIWQVTDRPNVKRATLSGLGTSRPRLGLALVTARSAPGLKSVVVDAPSGLRFTPGRGQVTVRGPGGRRISFKLQVRAGRIQAVLARPQGQLSLTLSSGAIVPSSGLSARARRRPPLFVTLKIVTTDAHGVRTTLRVRVKSRR